MDERLDRQELLDAIDSLESVCRRQQEKIAELEATIANLRERLREMANVSCELSAGYCEHETHD